MCERVWRGVRRVCVSVCVMCSLRLRLPEVRNLRQSCAVGGAV